MKRIKYFCYYDYREGRYLREGVQAASSKIDYIIQAINKNGVAVDLISKSGVSEKGFAFDAGGLIHKGDNTLRHFVSFGCMNSPLRVVSRWLNTFHFIFWFLCNVRRKEEIWVYHSLGYCKLFIFLKKIVGFKLIGEIEEIYQDVHQQSAVTSAAEYKFHTICDKFVYPNVLLNPICNPQNKPFLVVHGLYSTVPDMGVRFDDTDIHALYSGTFDPEKGGAQVAIEVTKYLPENFHVHITGFGDDKIISELKTLAQSVSLESKAKLTFHGFISRKELNELMQKCQVGLCTQPPHTKLNATSFPSKILNYMANGLVVLCGKNEAITKSSVGDIVSYYESDNLKDIAAAVVATARIDGNECRSRLVQLDNEFTTKLNNFLQYEYYQKDSQKN